MNDVVSAEDGIVDGEWCVESRSEEDSAILETSKNDACDWEKSNDLLSKRVALKEEEGDDGGVV